MNKMGMNLDDKLDGEAGASVDDGPGNGKPRWKWILSLAILIAVIIGLVAGLAFGLHDNNDVSHPTIEPSELILVNDEIKMVLIDVPNRVMDNYESSKFEDSLVLFINQRLGTADYDIDNILHVQITDQIISSESRVASNDNHANLRHHQRRLQIHSNTILANVTAQCQDETSIADSLFIIFKDANSVNPGVFRDILIDSKVKYFDSIDNITLRTADKSSTSRPTSSVPSSPIPTIETTTLTPTTLTPTTSTSTPATLTPTTSTSTSTTLTPTISTSTPTTLIPTTSIPTPTTLIPTTSTPTTTQPTSPLPAKRAWVQVGQDIVGDNSTTRCSSSAYLSASGNFVAVGFPSKWMDLSHSWNNRDDTTGTVQTYKYKRSANGWKRYGKPLVGENLGDDFGWVVELSEDAKTLAVGAPNSHGGTGGIYIYRFNTTLHEWGLQSVLTTEDEHFGLGESLSLSKDGNTLATVAQQHFNIYNETYHGSQRVTNQRVYVYEFNRNEWNLLGQVINHQFSDEYVIDRDRDTFGRRVAISADGYILAVGESTSFIDSGHVKLYMYDPAQEKWTPHGSEDILGEQDTERFGEEAISISSSGDVVAIAAPKNNNANGIMAGTVRVYRFNIESSAWEQLGNAVHGEDAFDLSGYFQGMSLSSDGMSLIIGSSLNDGNDDFYSNRGGARIYQYHRESNTWILISQNIVGQERKDEFGWSVSMNENGSMAAIVANGAHWGSIDSKDWGSCYVRIYKRGLEEDIITPIPTSTNEDIPVQTNWTQAGQDIDGEKAFARFGTSVSLSNTGNAVVVGAVGEYNEGNNDGIAKVFHYDTSSSKWQQTGQVLSGDQEIKERKTDGFGTSVAVSSCEGSMRVAVGAPSIDIDKVRNVGKAYVYDYINSTKKFEIIGKFSGEGQYNQLGINLVLSRCGNIVALGSWDGAVVYKYNNTSSSSGENSEWTKLGQNLDGYQGGLALSDDGYIVAVGTWSAEGGHINFFRYQSSTNEWLPYGTHEGVDGIIAGIGHKVYLSSDAKVAAIGRNPYMFRSARSVYHVYKIGTDDVWYQLGRPFVMDSISSISLSSNGMIIAIGNSNDNGARNKKPQIGMTSIYEYNEQLKDWVRISQPIYGERRRDRSGTSLSLSDDGSIVAIGASNNDGNGEAGYDCGHVRIYKRE